MHSATAAASYTSALEIAGTTVVLRCALPELHRVLHGVMLERVAVGQCGFTLEVEVAKGLRAGKREQAVFRGRRHLVLAMFGDEIFTFDLRRRRVCARVSEDTARNEEFWQNLLIPIALGLLGPTFGLVPVHAAALAGRRDLLLVGNSGAGKSTLAVAMAKLGWSLVSDDWTYVRATSGGLTAHGINVPVKLLPDAVSHFPELSQLNPQRSFNGELAFEVDARRVLRVETESNLRPEVVVFIERCDDETSFEPLERPAMLHYFSGSLERLPLEFPKVEATRAKLIERLAAIPAYKFSYVGSPADGAAQLDRYLKEPVQ